MPDPAIESFLSERKAARIKKNLKPGMSSEELKSIEREADEVFRLDNWLPDAAKRARQLAMVSHPGKFTHPSAKISSVISQSLKKPDGFLRTGNAQSGYDVLGNAAALDVYKFLSLTLSDGQTVLAHLEQGSEWIKAQFKLSAISFAELQQGLLAIKQSSGKVKTSEKIKQVYFPADGDYHLLSLLTPSGLMFKFKERINVIRFSESAKQARDDRRNQRHNEQGFDELYNMTVIGFGGTKPQNISVLNSQNGGRTYLLPSLPPQLEKCDIRVPKSSFFVNSLYHKNYQDNIQALHRLLVADYNNTDIREGCNKLIGFIIEQVIEIAWRLRQLPTGWSENTSLPLAQKIWLDAAYNKQRENDDGWLDEIIGDFARWLSFAYEKNIGKEDADPLVDIVELAYIKQVIADYQEALR